MLHADLCLTLQGFDGGNELVDGGPRVTVILRCQDNHISRLAEQIKILADRGITIFLSGMALGVDLWCARIVLDLRKRNPAVELR